MAAAESGTIIVMACLSPAHVARLLREVLGADAGDDLVTWMDETVPIYGGASMESQIRSLKRGRDLTALEPEVVDVMNRLASRKLTETAFAALVKAHLG